MATRSVSGRPRSSTSGRFVKQLLTLTLRSGRRVFSSSSKNLTAGELQIELLSKAFQALAQDTNNGLRAGFLIALQEVVTTYIPMVALKSGNLRVAILSLANQINNTVMTEIIEGEPITARITVNYSFQTAVWSILNYAIYHAVEFRKLDFYVDPTTQGTAPYSTVLFFQLYREVSRRERNNHLERLGWDLTDFSKFERSFLGRISSVV